MEEMDRSTIKVFPKPVKRNTLYGVGIDVHKHSLTVAIAEKKFESIKIVKVQPFTTDDIGYTQFWSFVSNYRPETFVFEASGVYSNYFHEFLDSRINQTGLNATIVRLNPRVAKQMHFASTNHDDPVDAKALAIIAVMGITQPFYGLKTNQTKIQELTRAHLRYGQDCTQVKNRIKRLLDHSGIYLRDLDLNTIWGWFFIEALANNKGTVKNAIEAVLSNEQVSSQSKKALEKRMMQWNKYQERSLELEYQVLLEMLVVRLVFLTHCDLRVEQLLNDLLESDQTLQKSVSFITSVLGLSVTGALTILSEIRDIRLFKNYRNFLNYAGLAPTIHTSGETSRTGRINRKSNRFLRTTFYQAGVTIATTIKERSDLKDFSGRMLARYSKGKIKYMKTAVKVARTIYALLKKGEWYNPTYESCKKTGKEKVHVTDVRIRQSKRSFRRMADWLIRKRDYLPPDVITRIRRALKLD